MGNKEIYVSHFNERIENETDKTMYLHSSFMGNDIVRSEFYRYTNFEYKGLKGVKLSNSDFIIYDLLLIDDENGFIYFSNNTTNKFMAGCVVKVTSTDEDFNITFISIQVDSESDATKNVLINNLMRLWVRFNGNLYGDESYLTHTLPCNKKTLYLSKTLTSIITLFTSMIVIILSLVIAYYSKENIEFVKNLLLPLAKAYDSTVMTIILAFIFVLFLEIMNILNSGYTGLILGHKKNNNKMLFSILFGFGTYMLTQFFSIVILFFTALFNKDLMNLFNTVDVLNMDTIKLCIYIAIICYTLEIIILYIVNSKLFSKGVNVD